jgi:hypothetical protein
MSWGKGSWPAPAEHPAQALGQRMMEGYACGDVDPQVQVLFGLVHPGLEVVHHSADFVGPLLAKDLEQILTARSIGMQVQGQAEFAGQSDHVAKHLALTGAFLVREGRAEQGAFVVQAAFSDAHHLVAFRNQLAEQPQVIGRVAVQLPGMDAHAAVQALGGIGDFDDLPSVLGEFAHRDEGLHAENSGRVEVALPFLCRGVAQVNVSVDQHGHLPRVL